MAVVSMKQLLEAGVHFGHQTRRWNPKMAEYIYMERNGIYIIDLQKTVKKLEEAYNFVRSLAENGENILFVGTKKQAQDAVREEASRVGQYYVNARWLGGMLTNFKTMRTRIDRLAQLRKMQEDGTFDMLPKKEVIKLTNEITKLEKYLGGVKEMKKLPGAIFVIDPRKELSLRPASCTSPSSLSSIPTATPTRSTMLSPATMTLSAPSASSPPLWPTLSWKAARVLTPRKPLLPRARVRAPLSNCSATLIKL